MKLNEILNPIDLFEMANLSPNMTGIPGVIYISTKQGSHGCRIKYFPDLRYKSESFVVTIPELAIAEDTTKKLSNNTKKEVIMFAHVNSAKLLNFWHNGGDMMDEEVTALKQSLKLSPMYIEKSHKLKFHDIGSTTLQIPGEFK